MTLGATLPKAEYRCGFLALNDSEAWGKSGFTLNDVCESQHSTAP